MPGIEDFLKQPEPQEETETQGESHEEQSVPQQEEGGQEAQAEGSQEEQTQKGNQEVESGKEGGQEAESNKGESDPKEATHEHTLETEEEEQQSTPEDYTKLIKEQLSERGVDVDFESLDDLAETIKSSKDNPFADERVKEINDFVKKGKGDLQAYITYKTSNFKDMEELDLVRMQTKEEYPNLSDEQIDGYLRDKYSLDEDEYSENQVSNGKTRLLMDGEKARKQYLNRQQELDADLEKTPEPQGQENQGPSEEEIKQFNQKVDENFKDALNFNELGFKYHVKDEVAQKIPKNLGEMFLDKEGNFDFGRFNQARVFASNPKAVLKAAIEQGKSLERESLRKDRYNQNLDDSGSEKPEEKPSGNESIKTLKALQNSRMGFGG